MKLKDLLNEVNIFQNNFVKVDMAETEIKKLFPEDTPEIKYDENGMYIVLDTFQYRDYEGTGLGAFSLSLGGIDDEIKNTKQYYVEYTKPVVTNNTSDTEDDDNDEEEEA